MTIYILGTNHNDMRSTRLVTETIEDIQPATVFVEYGDFRYSMASSKFTRRQKLRNLLSYKTDLNIKSRFLTRSMKLKSRFSSNTDPLKAQKSTDMPVAVHVAEEEGIDVIPMDVELSEIMNEVSDAFLSLDHFGNIIRGNTEVTPIPPSFENLQQLKKFRSDIDENSPPEIIELNRKREDIMIETIVDEHFEPLDSVVVTGAYHLPRLSDVLRKGSYEVNYKIY